MKTTIEFLNAIKSRYNLPSDGRLAVMLGITRSSVSVFMLGKNHLGDETCLKVAELLDLDPAYVVACIHAERAKDASLKRLWERVATTMIGVAAALAMIAILPTSQLPGGEFNVAFLGLTSPTLYIMSNAGIQSFALYSAICLFAAAFTMARLTTRQQHD